jgi:ribosomal protein S18 acetylase RimI-like enzyme
MAEASTAGQYSLRQTDASDREFLFELYALSREEEMSSWGMNPQQKRAFLEMQFTARARSYEAAYPHAEHSVILENGQSSGAMIVARSATGIFLVDIRLLPNRQNRGLGSHVIGDLIEESSRAGLPLRLSVLEGNRAVRLYERLGFHRMGGDALYCQMERNSA